MDYHFALAGTAELEQVYALIDRRIHWMDEMGIRQWNVTDYWGTYPREHYVEQLQHGHLYVLKRVPAGTVAGIAVLYETDGRWDSEQDIPAYYVHHFAADVGEAGAGAILLNHLEEQARRDGKAALRLDCPSHSVRLNRYYEEKGYVFKGTCVDGVYRGNRREKRFSEV